MDCHPQAQGWLCCLGLRKENAFFKKACCFLCHRRKQPPAPKTMPGICRVGAQLGGKYGSSTVVTYASPRPPLGHRNKYGGSPILQGL